MLQAAVQALLVKQVQGANKSQVQLVTGEPSPESLLLLERSDVEFTIASASGLPGIKCNFYSHFHLFKTLETRDSWKVCFSQKLCSLENCGIGWLSR